jgi:hypothetical protein
MINHEQLCTILQQAMEMHNEGVKVSVAFQVYVSAFDEKKLDNCRMNVKVSLNENVG